MSSPRRGLSAVTLPIGRSSKAEPPYKIRKKIQVKEKTIMEVRAVARFVRLSPQKGRLVADQVRNLPVGKALELLQFSPRKPAGVIRKVLESAIANAEHNEGADIDELKVSQIMVDEGPVMKRWRPRAKGRAAPLIKTTSHITVSVSDGGSGSN